jgi:hypothetical protein
MGEKYYKVLNNKRSCNGGKLLWVPQKWMPEITNIEPCSSGYHLCRPSDVIEWLGGNEIWLAEGKGECIVCGDKVVFSQARIVKRMNWNERTARLFAVDCAMRTLHIFENRHPDDKRPRQATIIAKRFANGKATKDELSAAWAAAGAAAWAAAGAAAEDAAWAAARSAAGDAAWAAAMSAARDAERQWHTNRLMEYLEGKRG